MGVIFAFSSIPGDEMPTFDLYDWLVKKGGHMLGYALLAWLLFRGWGGTGRRAYLLAFLGAVLYALSDEFHQSFVPGRNATLVDVAIDSLGALLVLLVLRLRNRTG